MQPDLTRSEMDVLRFAAGHIEAWGYAPPLSGIARAIGKSKTTAHARLERLEQGGLIRRLPFAHQAIEVLAPVAVPRARDGAPLRFIPVEHLKGARRAVHNPINTSATRGDHV